MSVCSADPITRTRSVVVAAGRHRVTPSTTARAWRAFDLVARLGNVVSVGALMVLAGTTAGLVGGMAPPGIPTVTVTFDHSDR